MTLEELGYNSELEKLRIDQNLMGFEVGRVIAEHKERYIVRTAQAEYEAEITGNMYFTAQSREDFPAVGDWVAVTTYDADSAIIHQVLPRSSIIKRQAVGQSGEIQIIATNIDYAFLVQAIDRDFSINRLERYLTLCNSAGVTPIIVLTKIDLIDEQRVVEISENIKSRIHKVPVIPISNQSQDGYDQIMRMIEKGKTYCLLGSSGVGKSTLINNLSGHRIMRTNTISQSTNKGRHVTSHRELVILENGGILVDNPGMREVGIADSTGGLETTFDQIITLSQSCRFKDCTHTSESGCSVLEALEQGVVDKNSYENWLKMEREKAHFTSTVAERRRKDKQFGKMVKHFKRDLKKNR